DLSADAVISAGDGCVAHDYGRGENAAPVAVAQAKPTTAQAGDPVTFDGSGSADDRTPADELTYAWDFGDGESGSGQSVQHAYAAAGEYTASLTVTDAEGLTGTDSVVVTVTGAPDLVIEDLTTVQNTGNPGGKGKAPKEGDKVVVRATVRNAGTADAPATQTGFTLDGEPLDGSPVATDPIPAGGSVQVDLDWDTRGVKDEHVIGAAADAGGALAESNEGNNTATLDVRVRGNKVENGDFQQANASGDGPEAWTGSDTGAGTTNWSQDEGSDGSYAATITASGGSALLAGIPTWTSDPIAVTAGELLELRVDVSTSGMSSSPGVGLAYLGAAGQLLDTVRLIQVPLATGGFTTLEKAVTLPPGVSQVRVVLFGFGPTDTATAGSVTFDEVGLYGS
ncbi:MAG: PKD domain-containing protein, partial [Candidatus Limnocylindria bacterium]